MLKKTKTIFRLIIFLVIFLSPFLLLGDPQNANSANSAFDYTPMEEIPGQGKPTDFYDYINAIYKFGIGAIGIAALLMISIGGYMYLTSAGNASAMDTAKSVITDAIVGVILALSSYLLLYIINPDLVKIKRLEPIPTVDSQQPGAPVGAKPGVSGGIRSAKCKPATTAACSVSTLTPYFGANAEKASSICRIESTGDPKKESNVDKCKDGSSFSIGLFQINLIANGKLVSNECNPKDIFNTYGKGTQGTCIKRNTGGVCLQYDCEVKNKALYESCVKKLYQPQTNIAIAKNMSSSGNTWRPWGANRECNF